MSNGSFSGSSECLEQVLQLYVATEQHQLHLLVEAQQVEVIQQTTLEVAADEVARALESARSLGADQEGNAPDPRRTALETARHEFGVAALALRAAVRHRKVVSQSLGMARQTRRALEQARAGWYRRVA